MIFSALSKFSFPPPLIICFLYIIMMTRRTLPRWIWRFEGTGRRLIRTFDFSRTKARGAFCGKRLSVLQNPPSLEKARDCRFKESRNKGTVWAKTNWNEGFFTGRLLPEQPESREA